MLSNDFNNAFKKLEALTEADFNLAASNKEEIEDFLNDDSEEDLDVKVVDLDAENEEELEDDNVGKIILQCPCCETVLMKNAEDIELPDSEDEVEDALVQIGDQCPVCFSEEGFKIVGKVAPYEEVTVEVTPHEDSEDVITDEEVEDEEEKNESLTEAIDHRATYIKIKAVPGLGKIAAARKALENAGVEYELIDGMQLTDKATKGIPHANLKNDLHEAIDYRADYIQLIGEPGPGKLSRARKALDDAGVKYNVLSGMQLQSNGVKGIAHASDNGTKGIAHASDYGYGTKNINIVPINEYSGNCAESCKSEEYLVDEKECGTCNEDAEEINAILANTNESVDIYSMEPVITPEREREAREVAQKIMELINYYGPDGEVPIEELEAAMASVRASNESLKEGLNDVQLDTDTDHISIHAEKKNNGDEMIAPLDFEDANEIVDAQDENPEDTDYLDDVETETDMEDTDNMDGVAADEETSDVDVTANVDDDEFADVDIDDVDEEKFDELGESYLKETYDNVKSYKTESIHEKNGKLVCEGLITFTSGNQGKTQFILEGNAIDKHGNCSMLVENAQITPGKKAMSLSGRISNAKFVAESLNYNYKQNNINLKGTVKTHNESLVEKKRSF